MAVAIPKANRQAALISAASIMLASIMLLSLRMLHLTWPSDQLDVLLLSLALGIGACFLLAAPRLGQAHLALGIYLLAIGGATMVLPPLLVVGYGQNDTDALVLFLGPLALLVGSILAAGSVFRRRQWVTRRERVWRRTVLLAGPGAALIILCPLVLGPRMWDAPPYGFDLVTAGWVIGAGIFLAGNRFAPSAPPDPHQATFSGSPQ
jgi:hypothetical protein